MLFRRVGRHAAIIHRSPGPRGVIYTQAVALCGASSVREFHKNTDKAAAQARIERLPMFDPAAESACGDCVKRTITVAAARRARPRGLAS